MQAGDRQLSLVQERRTLQELCEMERERDTLLLLCKNLCNTGTPDKSSKPRTLPPPAFSTWNRNLEFQKKKVENRSPETRRARGALSDNPAKTLNTKERRTTRSGASKNNNKEAGVVFCNPREQEKTSEYRSSLLAENETA
jgi:hypothetical protein